MNEPSDIAKLERLQAKAQDGSITEGEVASVVPLVLSLDSQISYLALYIVGRARARKYENDVLEALSQRSNPMKAALALKILCDWWNMADKYHGQLLEFMGGVDWDTNDDIRLQAISTAGDFIRTHKHQPKARTTKTLLAVLVNILECVAARKILRESAYRAIARAYGLEWGELPSLARHFNLETETDPQVIRWAKSVSVL